MGMKVGHADKYMNEQFLYNEVNVKVFQSTLRRVFCLFVFYKIKELVIHCALGSLEGISSDVIFTLAS